MLIAQRPSLAEEQVDEYRSRFVIEPLEPGFGYTIGNSLRRTLLSSIPGAAVTSIRIEGVLHEFSTVPGVKSIKVDWNTKNAKVEFDESKLPAQKVSQLIAATPHMMGASMHYGSWLALKSPDLKDDATAKKAKETLVKVAGVKAAEVFPAQHIVEVQFAAEGKATTADLIDALTGAGIKAENF